MNRLIKAIKNMQDNLKSIERNLLWLIFGLGVIVGLLIGIIISKIAFFVLV